MRDVIRSSPCLGRSRAGEKTLSAIRRNQLRIRCGAFRSCSKTLILQIRWTSLPHSLDAEVRQRVHVGFRFSCDSSQRLTIEVCVLQPGAMSCMRRHMYRNGDRMPDAPQRKPRKDSEADTLNLPRTQFAMKANLPQNEPARLAEWEDCGPVRKDSCSPRGRARSTSCTMARRTPTEPSTWATR